MPYLPHTPAEVRSMLDTLGLADLDALFDEIPAGLRQVDLSSLPSGLDESALSRLAERRAAACNDLICFAGGGAYDHHVLAAVGDLIGRGEYYTAYTPYQAEASQGTLQLLYEYQTMMVGLTGMAVSNASVYDGATALAEAVLMAARARRRGQGDVVLLPASVPWAYRRVVETLVRHQGLQVRSIACQPDSGRLDPASLQAATEGAFAVVLAQPNAFGILEDVGALTNVAHASGLAVLALVNPLTLAVLQPPGLWGDKGADIACGDGQPLGLPLAAGGPYFGFLCCRQELVRQLPGRIVGRTVDLDGRTGYTLTLQAREQHIRRAKATSNICTNQGLMVAAATMHMAMMGADGLRDTVLMAHASLNRLLADLAELGIQRRFSGPCLYETVVDLPCAARPLIHALLADGLLLGDAIGQEHPELGQHALRLCVTERRDDDDLAALIAALRRHL